MIVIWISLKDVREDEVTAHYTSKEHNSIDIRLVVPLEVKADLKNFFVSPHLEIVCSTHFVVRISPQST